MTLNPELFAWCDECKSITYHLPCCGNTTCNGGGCDDPNCDDIWVEATIAILAGDHPQINNACFKEDIQ